MSSSTNNKIQFVASEELCAAISKALFDCFPELRKRQITIKAADLHRHLIELGLKHYDMKTFLDSIC